MSGSSEKPEEEEVESGGLWSCLRRFFPSILDPTYDFSYSDEASHICATLIDQISNLAGRENQESTHRLGVLASNNPAFAGRIMGVLVSRIDDAVIEALWKTCKAAPEGITENIIPEAIQHIVFMGGRYKRQEEEQKSDVAIAGLMSLQSMSAQKRYGENVTKQVFEGLCVIGTDHAFQTAAALFYRNLSVLSNPLLVLIQKIGERENRDLRLHTPEVGNGLLRALTEPARIVSFFLAVPAEQKKEALRTLGAVFAKLKTLPPQLTEGFPERGETLQGIFQFAAVMTSSITQLHSAAFGASPDVSNDKSSSLLTIFDYRP
ncbi:MAG: hypothetical protein JNN09_06975 [Alphaproteobacteria bacterium]|nr:hypothetical protein [Alphaproteobacteria bacterium]